MPSNKEKLFQDHICNFLEKKHEFFALSADELDDKEYHFIEKHLIRFITATQPEKYSEIEKNYGTDTNKEILKALRKETEKKKLWLIMRDGLEVKGITLELYKPKPRSATSNIQEVHFKENIYSFKKEYRYNPLTQEQVDLVIWLNGLPIIVIELKHEDEGQNCDDAIYQSFLTRDFNNNLYKLPFLYVASSNTEVKVATDPTIHGNFMWFNAQLLNKAETEGEYPVEHLYHHAFSKDNIAKYLEHYLVFVPAQETIKENKELIKTDSYTIFPRYHQLRASKKLSDDVLKYFNVNKHLGAKYLINHSAGSGKTLTIAWMADLLDSLYSDDNVKIFDNIIILTDRRSLYKNVKDDLKQFTHLSHKINLTTKSGDLANFLEKDRDIIVTTIHKFGYIQDKLQEDEILKFRKVAFLIDEAHRSQEGKMAHTMRQFFTKEEEENFIEEDIPTTEDEITEKLKDLNISNQVFVAFTATTTPKAVAFFGEPFDSYNEDEAIHEGYILDVAQNIISYETLYNLHQKEFIPDDKDWPTGVVSRALKNIAYNDDSLIQYKSEVIIKLFEEKVSHAILGKGKAMIVASSRPAGLKYFNTIKTIIEEKTLPYKVLFAFSDYIDPVTNELVEENKVNRLDELHGGMAIEDVFDLEEYRMMVVANKFLTGFDQPLLSAMFLDKAVNGINAIQTISRLNRKHPEKEQGEILVVDFTNNSEQIFKAFNKHRKGSPYKERDPDDNLLQEVYEKVLSFDVFSEKEINDYVKLFLKTEEGAGQGESGSDTELSRVNQEFRRKFKERMPKPEDQRIFIGLLRRYSKLYYFISQFFNTKEVHNSFVIFTEMMSNILVKKGKTSELIQILKNIDLTKGAVKYHGQKANITLVKDTRNTGMRNDGEGSPPRTTIQQALNEILEKYHISEKDAIVIKEICEDVSNNYEIKQKIIDNRDNEIYLKNNAEPKVRTEVKQEYINRDLWDKLEDPIYIQRGGIISLMGKTIIRTVLAMTA